MLLHVRQGDEPKAEAFPPEVVEALAKIAAESAASTTSPATGPAASHSQTSTIPGSRRMELRSRS